LDLEQATVEGVCFFVHKSRKMTVGAGISVADGNLMVLGKRVLSHVHDKVVVTPACGGALLNGAFIGVESHQKGSRTVFPIGKLEYELFTFLFTNSVFVFINLLMSVKNKMVVILGERCIFVLACHSQEMHVLDYFLCFSRVLVHCK